MIRIFKNIFIFIKDNLMNFVLMTIGAFIMAIGLNGFLAQNNFVSGGVSGLSIIFKEKFNINIAFSQWLMNIPLFILGWIMLGKKYAGQTLYATIMFPVALLLTDKLLTDYINNVNNGDPLTKNPILAAVFGGLGIGIGLGLIFKAGGSTGGLDTPAQILHKYRHISLGESIAFFDTIVIVIGMLVFGVEKGLYGIVAMYTTSKSINVMYMGGSSRKAVYIISKEYELIKDYVLKDIDRGCTILNVLGGYTNEERKMLMCIIEVQELPDFKRKINSLDDKVFLYITDATEVHGEGFIPLSE